MSSGQLWAELPEESVVPSNNVYNHSMYDHVICSFRCSLKYTFRWLPCVTWQPNDEVDGYRNCEQTAADDDAGELQMLEVDVNCNVRSDNTHLLFEH